MSSHIRRLGSADVALMHELNAVFASAFDDPASYASAPPSDSYIQAMLGSDGVIALVALESDRVVGGLVAYVLGKLEQKRSEIYIYDLAVAEDHRRHGVASQLIAELGQIATTLGAWVIYVQADYGDEPAIALYEKHGTREDVLHFDITPRGASRSGR